MEIKIKNKMTNVVKTVDKNIADDFLGTKEWELVKDVAKETSKPKTFTQPKEENED